MTTKQLEHISYKHLWTQGTYLCFEVAMPCESRGMNPKERVDFLSYDSKGFWRFYELKISKSDFNSGAKKTFLGHYNYFILPYELYKQVKEEIPKHIGVYVAFEKGYMECVKKPIKQELAIDHDKLFFNFMQALSREYKKYRRILAKKELFKEGE